MIEIDLEDITPEKARAYLSLSGGNRPLAQARIKGLAAAIANGTWEPTLDAIKFDLDGRLLDGHHRLHACVAAGATFRTIVLRDVERFGRLPPPFRCGYPP